MYKIIHYLFIVRFRKLVSKGDNLAIFLILLFYLSIAFFVFKNYDLFKNYLLLFFVEIFFYHLGRTDIELLKLRKDYKIILLLEYVLYSLPFYLVLILKQDFLVLISILTAKIILINSKKLNFKTISYPFDIFNVFWHTSFRKYKILYFFPLAFLLIWVSISYDNENILYLILLLLLIICCIPSFEKERIAEIKKNPFDSKKYLLYQFKNSIINTFYITIPFLIIFISLLQWEKALIILILFIFPVTNILLKYIYFNNTFLHQIIFVFFITCTILLYGLPLLSLPFLYRKAIKNLNSIKLC